MLSLSRDTHNLIYQYLIISFYLSLDVFSEKHNGGTMRGKKHISVFDFFASLTALDKSHWRGLIVNRQPPLQILHFDIDSLFSKNVVMNVPSYS